MTYSKNIKSSAHVIYATDPLKCIDIHVFIHTFQWCVDSFEVSSDPSITVHFVF